MSIRHVRLSALTLLCTAITLPLVGESLSGTARLGLGSEGIASPLQVVGPATLSTRPARGVSLSVNRARDEATLDIWPHPGGITGLAVRCGIAGSDGVAVWQARDDAVAISNRIRSADIAAATADACGLPINNVVSLEAATRGRRLYVDMRVGGVPVRAQLWPKIDMHGSNVVWLSDQQVVGAGAERFFQHFTMTFEPDPGTLVNTVAQSFLGNLRYDLNPYEPPRSLALYCGRAGESGELVAQLRDARGVLSAFDLLPTQASGACGMAINTIASLIEAMLRGQLYVAGTLADGTALELRGQYLRTRGIEAVATPAQVVGGAALQTDARVPVGFAVNQPKDSAVIYVQESDLDEVDSLTVRCGIAGTEGPIVWRAPSDPLDWQHFSGADLESVDANSACGVAINNLASLAAAALERRLYVEIESGGARLRGQLWPSSDPKPLTWLSDQQVTGTAGAPPRWLRTFVAFSFTESSTAAAFDEASTQTPGALAAFDYYVADNLPFTSLDLKCGRAGEEGQMVAALTYDTVPRTGTLRSADLNPTDASGSCGVAVTNVASLFEAVLRGSVYAEGVLPDSTRVRGQLLPPQ